MAQQTRANLASDQATNLADSSDITAAELRGEFTDLTDSALLREDIDTSAELAAIVGDETGSGALVFATSPTLVTPTIGTADADSVYFAERADHVKTPAAGSAEIWLSNDTTQKLYMTDDADTDREFAFVTGGSTLDVFTGILGLNSGTAVDVDTQAKLETRVPDLRTVTVNAQTGTTYDLVLTDAAKFVTLGNATSNAVTIPANADVAFAVGTVIAFQLIGAGTGTIEGDTGVTLNGVSAGSGTLSAQWAGASIIKTDTNTWSVIGDIGTVA